MIFFHFYVPELHRSVKKAGIEVQELEGKYCWVYSFKLYIYHDKKCSCCCSRVQLFAAAVDLLKTTHTSSMWCTSKHLKRLLSVQPFEQSCILMSWCMSTWDDAHHLIWVRLCPVSYSVLMLLGRCLKGSLTLDGGRWVFFFSCSLFCTWGGCGSGGRATPDCMLKCKMGKILNSKLWMLISVSA